MFNFNGVRLEIVHISDACESVRIYFSSGQQ